MSRTVSIFFAVFLVVALQQVNGDSTEDNDRKARAIWLQGSKHNPQCTGGVQTLLDGQKSTLASHSNYGQEVYPSDYQCRWLVTSVGCDLSLVCDLGVNSPGKTISRDGRDTWCPPQEDYLRLEGYDGAYDTKYCGKERVSIKMKGPLTLSFVSQVQRSKRQERQGFINGLLQGFNCQITCKNSTANSPVQFPSKPKPSSDNSSTTSTQKPTTEPPTTSPKPQPSLNHTVPEESEGCRCGQHQRLAKIICPYGPENCSVEKGSIPWQVGLVNRRSWTPWCGGTLISDSYVLTAAHCMKNKKARSFEVILGDRDTSTRTETAEIRRTVENIVIHPKFGSRSTFDYDFALLKVWPPVNFETHSNIRPACLPEEGQENVLAFGGRTGTVSGWGLVDGKTRATQLQAVQVEVLPDKECTNSYKNLVRRQQVTDTMFCAASKGADACSGDSGGPLTFLQRRGGQGVKAAVVEGVVSWGRSCAKQQWPGVYARVEKVLDWIKENSKHSNFCS